MSLISVIDEDYDTSLSISWDEIEERINRQCSLALKASPDNRTKVTIPMKYPPKSAMKDHTLVFPEYSPPPQFADFGARAVYSAFNFELPPPKEPTLPVAKTNTHLLNYVHRLYVFKAYKMQQQWRQQQVMEESKIRIHLKDNYNINMDRMSKKRVRFSLEDENCLFRLNLWSIISVASSHRLSCPRTIRRVLYVRIPPFSFLQHLL